MANQDDNVGKLLGVIAVIVVLVGADYACKNDVLKAPPTLLPLATIGASLVALALPITLAVRGKGWRGLYLGTAVCLLLGTIGCFGLIPSAQSVALAQASGDRSQIAGTEFLLSVGGYAVAVWLAATLGAFLGAVMLRPARATQNQQ